LLSAYVERFNARDFDAIRDMLAKEVRLELVNRLRLEGAQEVGRYFHNYERLQGWAIAPALVDGRPAALVRDPGEERPSYFVLLGFDTGRVRRIRDFRYARYAIEGAELQALSDE
jgi:RNA polymerase sigma-70 factor (ECF subfamily)